MATQVTNVSISNGLRERFEGFLASFGAGITAYMERKSRLAQMEKLHAKTDEELAAMGLKREDIAHYVFRDLFYI